MPLAAVAVRGLSAQEQAWGRALDPGIRRRYWQSRSALRQLAARCLHCEPEAVPLDSPPGGAPRLAAGAGFVSLSHSGPMLLIAWSPRAVGVDLEPVDRPLAAAAIARRFFPPEEWAELAALPPEALRQAVLRSWVLKEAAIKWRQRTLAQELAHWHYGSRTGELRHRGEAISPPCCSGERRSWLWGLVGAGSARIQDAPC